MYWQHDQFIFFWRIRKLDKNILHCTYKNHKTHISTANAIYMDTCLNSNEQPSHDSSPRTDATGSSEVWANKDDGGKQ